MTSSLPSSSTVTSYANYLSQAAQFASQYASNKISDAAANSTLFYKSGLSSNYIFSSDVGGPGKGGGGGSISGTSTPNGSGGGVVIDIGVWKVQQATHKVTSKLVSVWALDKNTLVQAGGGGGFGGGTGFGGTGGGGWAGTIGGKGKGRRGDKEREKEAMGRGVEIIKKEVSSLSRLRHPCILEIVEPLEETRSSITFATEPIGCSLRQAIAFAFSSSASKKGFGSDSSDNNNNGDLDEVEIQKGLLHIAKGLSFLHDSAKIVHSNLTPEAIIINAKGDWKLAGFGFSIPLSDPTGKPARWEFPEQDPTLPASMSKNLDYVAPEFIRDEYIGTPNDMYSFGCVIHAIHTKSGPPFSCRGSINNLRENLKQLEDSHGVARMRAGWSSLGGEAQEVLSSLITPTPSNRMSATTFQSSSYFNSVLVSTLKFLDRDSFNSKSKEEQTSFMKGLLKILPQFSEKVVKRKVLPSLLEETMKHALVPFILPNVFYIASKMNQEEFHDTCLMGLKPLFTVKDPPQVSMALLDHIPTLQEKCPPQAFREEVMPLIYFCLESEMTPVLEKALKTVPKMCEGLDFTTVKQELLPKITGVFVKTTLLSVKVNTLLCFYSMIKILDKFTLTEKLVPLLAKIKTKEPSVMLATLAVYEELSSKIDVEAIATMILPQLWAFSVGPLLNADQFTKFMQAIKQLSNRVEEEHLRHLRQLRRLEDASTANTTRLTAVGGLGPDGEVDFEALVKGASVASGTDGLSDIGGDPWASFGATPTSSTMNSPAQTPAPAASPMRFPTSKAAAVLGTTPPPTRTSTTAASTIPNEIRSFGGSVPRINTPPASNPRTSISSSSSLSTIPPMSFSNSMMNSTVPISSPFQPQQSKKPLTPSMSSPASPPPPSTTTNSTGPNYNISMDPIMPTSGRNSSSFNNNNNNGIWGSSSPTIANHSASNSFTSSITPSQPLRPTMAPVMSSSSFSSPTSPPLRPSSSASNPRPTNGTAPSQWNVIPPTNRPQSAASNATAPAINGIAPPPGYGGMLQPKTVGGNNAAPKTNNNWADLDPLG